MSQAPKIRAPELIKQGRLDAALSDLPKQREAALVSAVCTHAALYELVEARANSSRQESGGAALSCKLQQYPD